jgi:hypothetical protein
MTAYDMIMLKIKTDADFYESNRAIIEDLCDFIDSCGPEIVAKFKEHLFGDKMLDY